MSMIIPPIGSPGTLYPWPGLMSNVQPFTRRSGESYLSLLYRLRDYVTVTLVNDINSSFADFSAGQKADIQTLVDSVNAAIADVNEAVQTVITSGIAVSDPVIAGVLNDITTASRGLVIDLADRGRGATRVSRHVTAGENYDVSIRHALDFAIANGLETVIIDTNAAQIGGSVIIPPLSNIIIEAASSHVIFTPKAGAGALDAVFIAPAATDTNKLGAIAGITFRKLTVNGGMTSAPAGPARNARVFGADTINCLIALNGDLVGTDVGASTEPYNSTITDVVIEGCRAYGTKGLPFLLRGVERWTQRGCYTERTLDWGYTWSKGGIFHDNVSKLSGDNGFSFSRGCSNITISDSRVHDSYYAGVHIAGFWATVAGVTTGYRGPQKVTATNVIVTNAGTRGFSLVEQPTDVSLINCQVIGVGRGYNELGIGGTDERLDDFGMGFHIRGLETAKGTDTYTYGSMARGITIVGCTVDGAANGGIYYFGTDILTMVGNTIKDVGSATVTSGATILPTNTVRNIGIGAPGSTAGTKSSNITATGNKIIDTRATPLTNWGFYDITGSAVKRKANSVTGTRNYYTGDENSRVVDNGAFFVGKLDTLDSPVRVGILSESVMDDLHGTDGDGAWNLETGYWGIQSIVDMNPRIEGLYHTSYYDTNAYKDYRIVPIGVTYDDFDQAAGALTGKVSNTGEVWTGTAGWNVDGNGFAVPTVDGNQAILLSTKPAFVSTSTGAGTGFTGGNIVGRRVSLVLQMDTTLPNTERNFNFSIGADVNNRMLGKVAVSTGGVVFCSMTKVVGGVSTGVVAGGPNPVPGVAATSLLAEITLEMEVAQVTDTTYRVAMYARNGSAGPAITMADFTAMGGMNEIRMYATLAAGSMKVDRIGIGDIYEFPRTLEVWNGSKAGSVFADLLPDLPTLFPVALDDIMMIGDHNYLDMTPDLFIPLLEQAIDTVRAAQPTAGIILGSENPEFAPTLSGYRTGHIRRQAQIASLAAQRGYGYIGINENAYAVNIDAGRSLVNTTDGTHPTRKGGRKGGLLGIGAWFKSRSRIAR